MKDIKGLSSLLVIGLLTSQNLFAGDFRVGGGFTEAFGNTDYSSPTIELGYDLDHIFSATGKYNFDDSHSEAQQLLGQFEFGYRFGKSVTIKPYASIGAVHTFGGDGAGNTGVLFGIGARAAIKFIYLNAELHYLPDTDAGNDDTDWTWDAHPAASLTLGVKF